MLGEFKGERLGGRQRRVSASRGERRVSPSPSVGER
jgi:hypothetical protein